MLSVEQIKKLQEENKRLKAEMTELEEKFLTLNGKSYSYYTTLQEIKIIAENAYCLTNYTNKDMANFAKQILCLITKAEEE